MVDSDFSCRAWPTGDGSPPSTGAQHRERPEPSGHVRPNHSVRRRPRVVGLIVLEAWPKTGNRHKQCFIDTALRMVFEEVLQVARVQFELHGRSVSLQVSILSIHELKTRTQAL